MNRKITAIILAGVIACYLCACGSKVEPNNKPLAAVEEVASSDVSEVTSKDVKIYWDKIDEPIDGKVYFVDGNTAVPYFEIEDFVELKNTMLEIEQRDAPIVDCRKEGSRVVLVRDNQSECVMDFEQSTIHFDNFDRFVQYGFTDSLVSAVWRHQTFEDGSPKYFTVSKEPVNRNGYPVTLNLSDYDIHLAQQDSNYYVPVQTMSDILLNEMTDFIAFNGENLFINDTGMTNSLHQKEFYSVPKGKRSEELAEFAYNELAFALDFNYGQKQEQNITDFRSYMKANELESPMLSENPQESAEAVSVLTRSLLGGRHTMSLSWSYLCDDDEAFQDRIQSIVSANSVAENNYYGNYMNGREQTYSDTFDAIPRYEEVGDTAILTFDNFYFPDDVDYYETEVTEEDLGDCYRGIDIIGLIKYAHEQINRENSPIENVVIDLSNNSGGDIDAGVYLLAWVMGDAPLSVRDTSTGAETTTYYRCDANYDGVFDEKDNLTANGKTVYCIISPITFSCANYVPCVLKETQSAVILGRNSSGGTCAVDPICTADGTVLWISGRNEICTVRNGTYYSVDKGAVPDFTFTKMETFYDRTQLVKTIHELY